MSRKSFQKGLSCYQAGSYQEALHHFNDALEHAGQNNYLILDTRAAVHLKLGDTKEAMKDAKKTIDVAPDRWQGYARAARLFLKNKKFDASLTMVKMALDRLNGEEKERRASLLSLEADVQQARRDLERHRQRFADHMGKLPIELFGEIARMIVQENHVASLSLSQVSKNWRKVVHNLPYLWDVLILTRHRPRQKAKVWLERSEGRIRELAIRSSALDVPHWSGDSLNLLQWRYVRILRVQKWNVAAFLRSIGQFNSLSNLEHFELDSPDPREIDFPFQEISPSTEEDHRPLRHLTLVSVTLFVHNVATQLKNLASLILHTVTISKGDLTDLLEANPSLEHLSFEGVFILPTINIKDATISLPRLTVLEAKRFFPSFICTLGLPALQILRVDNPPRGFDRFLQHLAATNCSHLTELSLSSCLCDGNSIINLLHISPDLQILEISNNASHATPIIEVLSASYPLSQPNNLSPPSITLSPVCPNLTHVNFSKCPDVQTGPLVRMIKSRLPPVEIPQGDLDPRPARIVSLVIDECPNVDSTWLAWFREKVSSVSCVYMKRNSKFRA